MADYYKNYSYKKDEYNNSSSAYAYAYDPVYEEEEIVRKNKEEKIFEQAQNRERKLHRFKLIVSVMLVFLGTASVMVSHASVLEQRVTNRNLNSQVLQLQNENVEIEAEISDKVDLGYIQTEAVGRLGMAEPQEYQIVHIDVAKQSYTIQYDVAEQETENKFFLESIVSLFRK